MNKKHAGIITASVTLCVVLLAGFIYYSDSGTKTGFIPDVGPKSAEKLDTVKVQLKWLHQAQFAGFYAAEQLGFYEQQGIDVELIPGGPTISPEQVLDAGDADFAVVGGFDLLKAVADGQKIKSVMPIYQITPTVFMTLKTKRLTKIDQFENHRIGIQQAEQQLLYRAMMKNEGLDPSTMTELAASYDLLQMIKDEIDIMPGYVINERLTALENDIPVNVFYPADYGVRVVGDVVGTSTDLIKGDPDLVKRFLAATAQGWEHVIRFPEEAPQFILQYNEAADTQHELHMMQQSLALVKPYGSEFGFPNEEVWRDMSALLVEGGIIDRQLEPREVCDPQFLPH